MTAAQAVVTSVVLAAVVLGVLWVSAQLTGLVAERFGEQPAYWQRRLLPFGPFGPVLLWVVLSRRGGQGGGLA